MKKEQEQEKQKRNNYPWRKITADLLIWKPVMELTETERYVYLYLYMMANDGNAGHMDRLGNIDLSVREIAEKLNKKEQHLGVYIRNIELKRLIECKKEKGKYKIKLKYAYTLLQLGEVPSDEEYNDLIIVDSAESYYKKNKINPNPNIQVPERKKNAKPGEKKNKEKTVEEKIVEEEIVEEEIVEEEIIEEQTEIVEEEIIQEEIIEEKIIEPIYNHNHDLFETIMKKNRQNAYEYNKKNPNKEFIYDQKTTIGALAHIFSYLYTIYDNKDKCINEIKNYFNNHGEILLNNDEVDIFIDYIKLGRLEWDGEYMPGIMILQQYMPQEIDRFKNDVIKPYLGKK